MKCLKCGGALVPERSTIEKPYRFVESGLSNIYLAGVTVHHCTSCREYDVEIPKLGPLMDVIAGNLLRKPGLLTGQELRYLRKHTGFQAQELAALLRINPAHLSRVENGKYKNLGETGDTLARVLIREASAGEPGKEALLDFAKRLMMAKQPKGKKRKPTFQLIKNQWRVAA